MFLRQFDEAAGCHDLEILLCERREGAVGLLEGSHIRGDGEQHHTLWPAIVESFRLDVDEMQGFKCKFRVLLVLLELEREGPCGGVHSLVVGFPETVHDFDISHCGFIEDSGAVVFVTGYEVEVGCYGG